MKKNELMAELIGIMLGDGSIGIYKFRNKNKVKVMHQLKVTLDSRNEEYTNYVSSIIEKIFRIKPKIHYKNGREYKRKENAVDIRIFRKEAVLFALNEIGLKISPKWNKMAIPPAYERGKLGLLVLRGLFDTDGHLSTFNNNGIMYPRIEIRLCPSPAQEQVNQILNEFGFRYKIQKLEREKTRVRISGKEQLKKWFELIGSSNSIHLNKAKTFLDS